MDLVVLEEAPLGGLELEEVTKLINRERNPIYTNCNSVTLNQLQNNIQHQKHP